MKDFFTVLTETGYASRDTAFFADNDNRMFSIKGGGDIVIIEVTDSAGGKLPKLNGIFEFNMTAHTTNATDDKVAEIRRIIEIKPFPAAA